MYISCNCCCKKWTKICFFIWFRISNIENNRRSWEKIKFNHTLNKKNCSISLMWSWSCWMVFKRWWSISKINNYSSFKRSSWICSISSKKCLYKNKRLTYWSSCNNARRINKLRIILWKYKFRRIWWSSKSL